MIWLRNFFLLGFIIVISSSSLNAEDRFTSSLFLDTYSAYAKNGLANDERPYVTQSSRNKDYHLNLASAGIGYDDGLIRGKLVGQYGESVNINYNAEPRDSFKYVQESYLGYYFNKNTSIDVGTFLAHIGAESWLSKDNYNYTRSYIAEFSPYYETGVRVSHKFNDQWSGQLLGVNGWQNTTDGRHPALGTQLQYTVDAVTVTSNTFVGSENNGTRLFHNLIALVNLDNGYSLLGSIDVGHQSESSPQSSAWWGYSVMGKKVLNEKLTLNGRIESYQDPNGIIVTSVTGKDFRAYGVSLGLDFLLGYGIALRSEVKQFISPNQIFTDNQNPSNNDTLMVLSLSFFNENKF
jgi:hypothetical protein